MKRLGVLSVLCVLMADLAFASPATDKVLQNLKVPSGFHVELFSDEVPNARSMTLGSKGTVFVGTRNAGKVYAVVPSANGGKPTVLEVASGLNMPNGVAYRDGALYVAEVHRILRFDNVEDHAGGTPKVVREDLPKDRHHGWRYIAFGPDGKLYVPIGAPCNVCDQPKYAVITRMNADGSGHEVFAEGVRNSVGFTWHPRTQELWFTENGRDWLGEDTPPCEINRAPRAGLHFGFPFCHGTDIRDPEFGARGECSKITPPVHALGAHVAPLGIRFYDGNLFPAQYRGQLFVAEHGSWNRKVKSGYRVTRARLDGNNVVAYEPFVVGFKRGEETLGRPVDLLQLPDGSLLISDDQAGALYRVTYRAP